MDDYALFRGNRWAFAIGLAVLMGVLCIPQGGRAAFANDWRMWGYDAARSSRPPADIPESLHLHWAREMPAPRRAWRSQMDDRDKLEFDLSYSPVVMGGRMFVASMTTDSLTAYDADTGEELWRYYADGPARLAPAAWRGKVYFISDDGHLRCLDAETGELRWKFDARPSDHRVLGNERVVSMWAARGGPAVKDGTIYFAAGVWPFLRTFVFALDAETGEVEWANKSHSTEWQAQPHGGAYSFAGVSPQGYLAVSEDRVVVSGGRSFPSLFDRRDGSLVYSQVRGPKLAGGYRVRVEGDYYFNHGRHYLLADGTEMGTGDIDEIARQVRGDLSRVMLLPSTGWRFRLDPEDEGRDEGWYEPDYDDADWRDDVPTEISWQGHLDGDYHGVAWYRREIDIPDELPSGELYLHFDGVDEQGWIWLNGEYVGAHDIGPSGWDQPFRLDVQGMLNAGETNQITVRVQNSAGAGGIWQPVQLIGSEAYRPRVGVHTAEAVQEHLDDDAFEVLAARGRLYVVTKKGTIYCFGPDEREPVIHSYAPQAPEPRDDAAGQRAEEILEQSGRREGYAMFMGAGDGDLIEQVAVRSELHIVALEPDEKKVASLRRRFDDAGLYGKRIALLPVHPADAHYPQYISSLVVMEDPAVLDREPDASLFETVYERIRPYDGRALLRVSDETEAAFQAALGAFEPEAGRAAMENGAAVLARTEALPGSGQWTHQYADSAQSVMSGDLRARPPFGPIWFGGPNHDNILPRHAAGPRPQVSSGRLTILGVETLSARCVFTGREIWEREFPGIGHPFTNLELEERWRDGASVYMTNQPGASYIGSPYVSLADVVYVRYQGRVYRLDPATGETVADWPLPARSTEEEPPDWGHISVHGDYVVTTTNPHVWRGGRLGTWGDDSWDGTSSERIVVLNRHSGEVAWTRDAEIGFRHNAIASGNGLLFVNDLLSEEALEMARRRGMEPAERPRMYALDIATGEEVWTDESAVFGTFFSYSKAHDVLIEGGSRDGRRVLSDEPTSLMIARRGADGEVLWERSGGYHGPVILRDDMIISARPGPARCLLTGGDKTRTHPITGEDTQWSYWKTYGCGTANASPHLLLFRSGAAGFTDLEHDGGTGTLGGFRTGCTSNMIAADGVLNAPDYTRTCGCSYQNQTSLGLVHMPEMELWTVNRPVQRVRDSIRSVGVNIAAPGDRRADNGTLWTPFPQTPAPAPEVSALINTVDYEDAPVRIVSVTSSADGLPANSVDGDPSTQWQVQSDRRGWFNEWVLYELNEPVALDCVEVAWTGPEGTQLRIEASLDGSEWTTVASDEGEGYGLDRGVAYRFEPVEARMVRISLGEHGDMSADSRGRRHPRWARVSQVRIGELAFPEAYAYFMPKEYFRKHSLEVDRTNGLHWVASSGVRGIRYFELLNVNGNDSPYTVSLHFAEPDGLQPGQRVFDIRVPGGQTAEGFDPSREAGGPGRAVIKTFEGVSIGDSLRVEFAPRSGSQHPPVLSGVEIIRQE